MRTAPWLLGLSLLLPGAEGPSLDEAKRLLGETKWEDRIKGLEMIEALGKGAEQEKAAAKALADADWAVVIRAAKCLGAVGGEETRDELVKLAVEGEIAWIRDAATDALRASDAAAGSARLLGWARGMKEPWQQARALRAAGRMGVGSAVKGLTAFTQHREAEVATEAVRALGAVAAVDPAARADSVDLLRRVLGLRADRKHFFAYAAAVEGLGRVPTEETTAILAEEISRVPDGDPYIPERIARGLLVAGRPDVAPAVRAALAKEKAPAALKRYARLAARAKLAALVPDLVAVASNPEERVRTEAVRALGLLAGPGDAVAGAGARTALADKSPLVRREAVTALSRILPAAEFRALAPAVAADRDLEVRLQFVVDLFDRKDLEALPLLAGMFADREWRVASAAAAAYGALGVAADLAPLLPLKEHKDWRIRGAAFEGMGRLRAKESVPHLIEGLRDRDPVVKGVCHANLQILTTQSLGPDPAGWTAWWAKHGGPLEIRKKSRRDAATIEKEKGGGDRYGDLFYGRKKGVEILQKARILVVLGRWDHAEKVLEHLSIPHTALRAQQLKDAGLNPNQVILVNCEGSADSDSCARLQWFVNVGGYLMSTDWALANAVRNTFPGFAGHFPGANTGNDVVVVEEAQPGHPFTAGVFDGVPAMKWWLEIQAFPITIDYPERSDILVDSAEMKRRYGASPLALAFRWGLGKVQHSVSHFALQEEGMTQARGERARMIFAADHLGLPMEAIRELAKKGAFTGQLNEETMKQIAPDYSMFRLIVNVVAEKSRWVEEL